MYLKKIIAQGFKSFADNTIINLENYNKKIVGIVGPNGSGKSNVVDAVRWVLGEQSVKSLRGDSNMVDVIFAGSKSRPAMNYSTVTIIFDNSDKYLNVPYEEVAIKRRLYKDGTNEFYLNDEKCRLKDIQNLLMDSGISKESFNIISQGKIDSILSSKPEDRRVVFEEAAGVIKYKKRKEEAFKRMEKTKVNMERISDIINELENQLEPLRDQKIKAEAYIKYSDELKELEISLIAAEVKTINDRFQSNKDKVEYLKKELINLSTMNSTNESKSTLFKTKLNDIDLQIKNSQDELLKLITTVEKLNSQKQILVSKKKLESDDSKLHNELVNLQEDLLNTKKNINKSKEEISLNERKIKDVLSKIEEEDKNLKKLKNKKAISNEELNRVLKEINILNNKIETLKYNIESNDLLPSSVKSVINNPKLRGIHNTIESIIETDEAYIKPISVVLGGNAFNVIADDENCAKEAIAYLKNNNLGRVTFFPLNIIKGKYIDENSLKIAKSKKGFIDVASNLVKYDKKYKNIIENQLGNILVVENIDIANELSKLINYKYRIVTLSSEVFHVGGSLTGGTIKNRNILTLKDELESNIKKLNKLVSEEENLENEINTLDYNLKSAEDKIYLYNKEKINYEGIIDLKSEELSNFNEKVESIDLEINSINNSIDKKIDIEEEKILNEYYKELEKKDKLELKIRELNEEKIKLNNDIEVFEHNIKKDNTSYNEKNNELRTLEIEVNRDDVKLDNLLNTLNETYSMTYENAIKLYKTDIDIDSSRSKVSSLKRKIKDLGQINIIAPEEYKRISDRYEFLLEQQNDLINAKNTLIDIIDEMDAVMKQEFLKAFSTIQKNFSETFKELFKGGHAELKLTDPNNILETGIEISACPPGKTLKSINLLSGGEKTFTAISLLFSILKSRPVPFCIFDEVEAALDEVNVEAFGNYLTKLKEMTQFIVITHKNKTMYYADALYGITMQESGVSKLVSVKLEEVKD